MDFPSSVPGPDDAAAPEAPAHESALMRRLREVPPWIWGGLAVAVFLGVLVIGKLRPERFSHKEAGITFVCPQGWFKEIAEDKSTAFFYKRPPRKGGENASVIKFSAEWGNPYGSDAMGYLANGVLAPARHTFGNDAVNVLFGPGEIERADIKWAALKFIVNYSDTYHVYATMANGRTFALTLVSKGPDGIEDQSVVERLLKSVRIEYKKQERFFR